MAKNFTLDLNSGLTQVLAYDTETYLYGLDRLGYEKAGEDYEYLPDALGSVRQVIKASGANVGLTLAQSYDPYGNVIYTNGSETSYGFTGGWTDSTGMVYLRARYYAPETGRFLSKDAWDGDANTPMSYNKWAYVYGNPINYTDLSGEQTGTPDCNKYEEICHIYGLIPDNEGIAIVNDYRNAFTEDNIHNSNLSPTHIAAAIAVQSQWMNDWWQQQQEGAYKYYLSVLGCDYEKIAKVIGNPGLGYGGIAVYDKKNGVDIAHFGDPNTMENSIAAISKRIENGSGQCLYNTNKCTKLDKLIVIGMAQNAGYNFPDGANYKSDNPKYKIGWEKYFGNKNNPQNKTINDLRAKNIGYINFNTQFQLKLYIQDLRELVTKYNWEFPDSVSISDINEILTLTSKNYQ